MTEPRIDFLYLNEQDMIDAGVRDMARCIDVQEETLVLLRNGDFRMAGSNAMSHGAMIGFPDDPPFERMPQNGPDRRFMSMPAYLGGRFHTAGVKWYGSNVENRGRGLPRSIHLVTLNDADTAAPLAHMSGNLLSAYRTGAIPGVAVKHLATPEAETFGIVGPGVIGRAVTEAALVARPSLRRVLALGVDDADVDRYRTYVHERFPQVEEVITAASVEDIAGAADVMTVTVTTDGSGSEGFPYLNEDWIKPGCLLLLPAAVRFDDHFLTDPDIHLVVDSWRLYDAWAEEYGTEAYQKLGIIGTHWHDLYRAGELPGRQVTDVADIITGAEPGRRDDKQIILYSAGGMPVEDVAWATEIYRRAVQLGIGTKLNLWEQPELF